MRYRSIYVASSIFFFVHLFFLLRVRSRRDLGSYISNSCSLSAYLIVRPGLPLLQAIGRYEISLTRNDLASWLAQRAART